MQSQARLNRSHQSELQKTTLGRVPECLVNVTQIKAVGLEGAVLLHGQGAEKDSEGEDEQETQ